MSKKTIGLFGYHTCTVDHSYDHIVTLLSTCKVWHVTFGSRDKDDANMSGSELQ